VLAGADGVNMLSAMTVVLFHSGSVRVVETTHFSIALM
jgi:hypothetical protein